MAEAIEPEPREVDVSTTTPADTPERRGGWRSDVKWASSLLLVAILGLSGWNNGLWQETPAGREDIGRIARVILAEQGLVFLLQLMGILLVAALIASVVLAIRDPEPGEELAGPEYTTEGYYWGKEGR